MSGIRGVVGRALTPPVIVKYVVAFCHLLRQKKFDIKNRYDLPTIVLGRDSRVSGPWMELIVKGDEYLHYNASLITFSITLQIGLFERLCSISRL